MKNNFFTIFLAAVLAALAAGNAHAADVNLLNVSYDPTRELYKSTTRFSPNTGKPKPAIPSPSINLTRVPENRRVLYWKAWKPMW